MLQLVDVLAHSVDGRVENLPDVEARQIALHALGEDPFGDGGAVDDLSLEHLVDHDDHHLKDTYQPSVRKSSPVG